MEEHNACSWVQGLASIFGNNWIDFVSVNLIRLPALDALQFHILDEGDVFSSVRLKFRPNQALMTKLCQLSASDGKLQFLALGVSFVLASCVERHPLLATWMHKKMQNVLMCNSLPVTCFYSVAVLRHAVSFECGFYGFFWHGKNIAFWSGRATVAQKLGISRVHVCNRSWRESFPCTRPRAKL